MARTDVGARLTEAHRLAQLGISRAAMRDFLATWRLLDKDRLRESFPAYYRAAMALINAYRARSSALSAAYLSQYRRAEGVDSPLTPILAADPAEGPSMTSLFVTGPIAVERGQRQGKTPDDASTTALVLSLGVAARLVLNGGRETITATVADDTSASGFVRVTSGKTCSFCRGLAAEGPVPKEHGSTFRAHDHCGCTAEPYYGEIWD